MYQRILPSLTINIGELVENCKCMSTITKIADLRSLETTVQYMSCSSLGNVE